MLTAKQILETKNYKTNTIHVDGWDTDVKIRSLSAKDVDKCVMNGSDEFFSRAADIVIAGVINDKDKPLFEGADKNKLLEQSHDVLGYVSTEILVLSGLAKRE